VTPFCRLQSDVPFLSAYGCGRGAQLFPAADAGAMIPGRPAPLLFIASVERPLWMRAAGGFGVVSCRSGEKYDLVQRPAQ
jgi:hypothetical protein